MSWTNKQKSLAVQACRAARISEEHRVDMILRSFANATCGGCISSTSPKLTNQDFAQFMSVVERFAGGKILHFTAGYWQRSASDHLQRMRFHAQAVARSLESCGRLAPGGVGLAGWIEKRVTKGESRSIDELDYHGLLALILGLEAYAKHHEVQLAS